MKQINRDFLGWFKLAMENTMQPHEQRVVEERNELGDKIRKLSDFLGTKTFDQLPDEDRDLLLWQKDHMSAYWATLNKRIDRF